jgi:nucleotide-binding universal stress UspA family protein
MYKKILAALDHSDADGVLLPHLRELAVLTGAELLLVHVADGWAARNVDGLNLAESEEMKADRDYLEETVRALKKDGLRARARLALGDPPREILKIAAEEKCDLLAMTTHGHRLVGDLLHGSTIDYVRHRIRIPLLILSAIKPGD